MVHDMVESVHESAVQSSPSRNSSKRKAAFTMVVAGLSSVAACAIAAGQERPLGDDPVVMILTGSFLAMVSGRIRVAKPLALGIASMIGFPVWAAVDLARNGGHNLLPFEVAIYGAYFVLGTFVAAIGYHWK